MPIDWTGNSNSIWKANGASNHSKYERQSEDYYATDPVAIDKLLEFERLHTNIWECACGGGHLSERLTELGYYVCSSDIVDRGYKRLSVIEDFLKAKRAPFHNPFDIITNPPYRYSDEFVLKALELLPNCCKCFMLLRLTYLEGKARKEKIFTKYPPKTIYVFSKRVMCAKNGEFERFKKSGGSAVAYAWFVWEKGRYGKTEVKWL